MARNKEIAVLVLDVGPSSNPYLEDAKEAVTTLLTSKLLFKASHEVAILLFGADETKNELHQEFRAQGDDFQYLHISELASLAVPQLDTVKDVQALQAQKGKADFLDGLTAAIDMIYKVLKSRPELERATCIKRIIFLSNFAEEVEEDEGFQFGSELLSKLDDQDIRLEVCCTGPAESSAKIQSQNLLTLKKLMRGRQPTICQDSAELKGLFPLREMSSTAYYSGPMMIGEELAINVKVTKKSSKERMPTMAKYSEASVAPDANHTVSYERMFKKGEEDVDEEKYAPEDMGKAYKYGSQIVPMSREQELALKYAPDKAFNILGTVSHDKAPRHLWVGDTWFVAPEKGNTESFLAMSAIARSLLVSKTGLLARFVPRANGEVSLGIMYPYTEGNSTGGCFTMNLMPYEADVRPAHFTTFAKKPEILPTNKQLATMDRLIDAFMLTEGDTERRSPESTSSPSLHVFLQAMLQKALDPSSNIKDNADDNPYARSVLEPDIQNSGKMQESLKTLLEDFPQPKKPENPE